MGGKQQLKYPLFINQISPCAAKKKNIWSKFVSKKIKFPTAIGRLFTSKCDFHLMTSVTFISVYRFPLWYTRLPISFINEVYLSSNYTPPLQITTHIQKLFLNHHVGKVSTTDIISAPDDKPFILQN